MIVNQWTKYYKMPNTPGYLTGYDTPVMDNIFNSTGLSGFLPCEAMIIDENNAYERVMDVLQAFSLIDTDGEKWGLDSGLVRPLGYETDTHAQMILNNFNVVLAWITTAKLNDEYKPYTSHLIVEMPDSIIRRQHYETHKLCDCNLGKYYVEIEYDRSRSRSNGRSYPQIHFWQKTEWYDGREYFFRARHPHISNGEACWGDMQMNSFDPLKSGNVFASLVATKVFLRTYNPQSPYDAINLWQNEWWTFDLPGLFPHFFNINGNVINPDSIAIPNPNAVAVKNDEMLNNHIGNASSRNQDQAALLSYGFNLLREEEKDYGMPFHVKYIFQNIGIMNRMNVMPLITRLVLTRGMTWLKALIVSIKILYSEWQNMMSMAPKRWPQGVIKKSEYNIIRAWSNMPNESQYYKLPAFYRWRWSSDPDRLTEVTNAEMRIMDIDKCINSIDTIRARRVSFNLRRNPSHNSNSQFPMEVLDKVNDPEYLHTMEFNSFRDDEFPTCDPANKKAICRKLRAVINDLDGLYQNAKYLQNKRFLTIIEKEKEILSNEASNYRPVATKDKLPFESL